jgi:hypothetical protein
MMAGKSAKAREAELALPDNNENFAYIAGYTSSGCAYGVTWEELKRIEDRANATDSQHETPIMQGGQQVSLNAIIEQMEMMFDETVVYFKRSTGEFISTNDEGQSLDDWMEGEPEAIRSAAEVLLKEKGGDYVPLPSRFDIHEYAIIERFCDTVANPKIANDLLRSISGKGAFRRFKDALYRHAIEKDWYRYKDDAYKEIAREWCKEHGIIWSEDTETHTPANPA